MRKARGAIAAAAVVLAAVGFAQTGPGRAVLRDAGITGTGQSYTALAFASPAQLPTQLYSRVALLDAAFVIRNSSAKQRQYPWQLEEISNGQVRQLAGGQATVAAGASTTISPGGSSGFVTSCSGGRMKIEVLLPGAGESIGFWTTCWSGAPQ
jgi:hypothetical protein